MFTEELVEKQHFGEVEKKERRKNRYALREPLRRTDRSLLSIRKASYSIGAQESPDTPLRNKLRFFEAATNSN